MITEATRRANFGQERLIVRGSNFLPLERAALLRQSYNEYPERWPLVEGFPRPGQRGGSRPPSSSGGGEGGEGSSSLYVPPGASVFPPSRLRPEQAAPPQAAYGAQPIPGGSPFCDLGSGGTFSTSDTLANGTSTIVVPPKFPFPFVITFVEAWSSIAATGANIQVKVSENDDSSGGTSVPGTAILIPPGVADNAVIAVSNAGAQYWPFYIVSQPNWFLKLVMNNTSGGAAVIMLRGSWQRIP